MPAMSGRRRASILGAAVLVATFAWLLYGGLDKNVVFFLTRNEQIGRAHV